MIGTPKARSIQPGGEGCRRRRHVRSTATHRPALDEAASGYEMFQKKDDGAIKIVLEP
jgi:threonine dehydrogenase-like Zn-dependent dehydrogenase